MDRQVVNILVKSVAYLAIAGALLPMFSTLSIAEAIAIGIVLVVVAYILGDLFILPRFGNTVAVAVDVVTAAVVIWAMPYIFGQPGVAVTGLLVTVAVLGIAEWFFHGFLNRPVVSAEESPEA